MPVCESMTPEPFFFPRKKKGLGCRLGTRTHLPCHHILVWSLKEAKNSTCELDFPASVALRSLKGSETGVLLGRGGLAWSGQGQEEFPIIRNVGFQWIFLWVPHTLETA